MRNITSRDRVAKQFRVVAGAAQALAIQEDQEAADPVAGVPVRITRQKKALMLNALDNTCLAIRDACALGGGTGTAHGISGATSAGSLGNRGAPVPVPHPRHQENWMKGAWARRDFIELGALPGAVPCARLHARQVLREWGVLTELSDSVELLVSELVTNSITASQSLEQVFPVRLWLLSDKARVLILVWDASPKEPARIEKNEEAENGRGLLLVKAISDQWNWYRTENIGGKVVWASVV
jgi:anti-sigma regulatory factor (Ser/Thr protein kinase)